MSKAVAVLIVLFILVVTVFVLSPPVVRRYMRARYDLGQEIGGSPESRMIGLAIYGRFRRLGGGPVDRSPRLTTMPMQAARGPESDELFLDRFDGRALIIQGVDSGGWIYSAKVIAVFSPATTALLRYAYSW